MSIAAIKDPHLLPYGVFVAEDVSVIYDRNYRPIVRVPGRWPDCDSASATVVDPTEWIKHDRKEWFYNDGSIPRRNKRTRETLQSLVDKMPALASEIERRDRAAERADCRQGGEQRPSEMLSYRSVIPKIASQTSGMEFKTRGAAA